MDALLEKNPELLSETKLKAQNIFNCELNIFVNNRLDIFSSKVNGGRKKYANTAKKNKEEIRRFASSDPDTTLPQIFFTGSK